MCCKQASQQNHENATNLKFCEMSLSAESTMEIWKVGKYDQVNSRDLSSVVTLKGCADTQIWS